MNGFDAGVVLVIIFSGAAWALGHRTKAIEILIGACCGYILARHAVDIRDFLKEFKRRGPCEIHFRRWKNDCG